MIKEKPQALVGHGIVRIEGQCLLVALDRPVRVARAVGVVTCASKGIIVQELLVDPANGIGSHGDKLRDVRRAFRGDQVLQPHRRACLPPLIHAREIELRVDRMGL